MDGDEGDEGTEEVVQDGQDAVKKKKKPRKKKKGKSEEVEEAPAPAPPEEGPPDYTASEWVDITGMCNTAVSGMGAGEMIESPNFRLVDAICAIEIMDPKMDSGFRCQEDMTIERAAEVGILTTALSHEDMVTIWDQLLMYYMLWLEGHTIVQTCFSCLYLQDLERHVKPVPLMSAFVDAFLAASRRANGAIMRAGIFDDEDFVPELFGMDLDACAVASEPAEVARRLEAERKALASSPSELAEALAHRLEFIGEYALALVELVDEPAAGGGAKAGGGGGRARGGAPRRGAQERLTACLGLLERLRQSARLPEQSAEALRCFDASINRSLLVPGPPRLVQPMADPRLALDLWASHVHELLLCLRLPQRSLEELLRGAIKHEGQPNVLPRSMAQLRAQEKGLVRRLVLDSLTQVLFPAEALQHCKKGADSFLSRCEPLFAHLLRLAHANPARRFRRLAHVFADFNYLQNEAWTLDQELKTTFGANLPHARPCWVFIFQHCLQAMIAKLLLGFELDLYDQFEFHMIYWYVEYLFGLRIYTLNEVYHAKEQPAGGASKAKRGPQKHQQGAPGGLRPKSPPPSLLLLEATQASTRGLFRLLAFCLHGRLLRGPPAPSGGLEQRFVLRFRPLEHFRLPNLPLFSHFEKSCASVSSQLPGQDKVVLDAAAASLGEGAQLLDRVAAARGDAEQLQPLLEEAKAMKRVVVANQLAVTRLSRLLENGPLEAQVRVVASLTHHRHLASVTVDEKAKAADGDRAPRAGGDAELAAK